MGDECSDDGKWAENMYWTHFQSIRFCQFLTPGFDQQLAIPPKFSNNLKNRLPENVTLKGPCGAKWKVGLVTSGDNLLFKHGWSVFVEDHCLEEDDVLIFKYDGHSLFDVSIFSGVSLCEREASYFLRKGEHAKLDDGCPTKTKTNMRESSVEELDSSYHGVDCTPSKRPRKDDNFVAVQSRQHKLADGRIKKGSTPSKLHNAKWDMRSREPSTSVVAQKVNSDAKKGSTRGYPVQYLSNRRIVTAEEKEKVLKKAHEASTNKDSFIVVMRPSHVYRGFYMSIPSEWATRHLPHKNKEMILRIKENTWPVKFYHRVYGGGFAGGWRKFSVENNLEEFDACVFDLASGTNDAVILDVSICRVVEEVTPLTCLNPPSTRQGRRPKFPRRKPNQGT